MARRKGGKVGGARPGAGRKPLPPGEARRHAVLVKLRDAEMEKLEGVAKRRGMRVATLAHELLVAALRRRRRF